jgi:hypothetical protein
MNMKHVFIVALVFASFAMATHLDDTNGELTNFSYDKVIFRTIKDCSLDKLPGVSEIQFY